MLAADPDVIRQQVEQAWSDAVTAELRRRMRIVRRVHNDPMQQGIILRYLATAGVEGLIAFARDWCWTYDPRNQSPLPKNVPVVLWPRQEQLLREMYAAETEGRNLLIQKSRDLGVTWTIAGIYYVWRWLFTPGWAGAVGSRKAELIDRRDDPKCLFAKPRWIIEHIPRWMRPAGWGPAHDNHMRLVNPANGAAITGEAGANCGRGGRNGLYFLDEFGDVPRPADVDAAVSGNARSVIYCHTATPPGTYYDQLRQSGRVKVFDFGWEHDPRKDPGYRDRFIGTYGPDITARELDRDFRGVGFDSMLPYDWVRAAVGLELSQDGPREAGLDVGGGSAESVLVMRSGPVVTSVDAWRLPDPTATAMRAGRACVDAGVPLLRYDSIGVGAGVGGAVGMMDDGPEPVAVNVALPATTTFYDDVPDRYAGQRFTNLRAELWWSMRLRFQAAWRRRQGEDVPDDQCISIPDDPVLIAQLCAPKMQDAARGLIRLESKDSMARRGLKSPDRADAMILAFAEQASSGAIFIGFA